MPRFSYEQPALLFKGSLLLLGLISIQSTLNSE